MESPWPNTKLLGAMLDRENSLKHPLMGEVFNLVEYVLRHHSALMEYLDVPRNLNGAILKR